MAMVTSLRKKVLLCFILFSLFLVNNLWAKLPDTVRVLIVKDSSSARLKVVGPYQLIDSKSRKIYQRGINLNTTVTSSKKGILFGSARCNADKVKVVTEGLKFITLDGRRFRGDIEIIKENNKLSIVNYLELEDYVKGILYHEVSHYWPMEALKAQAIVSRTYACYQINENSAKDFDVTSDIYSQVYGGSSSERYRTNRAVEETKGKVLFYRNRIFPAFFHACCGGHTQDASMLWNIDIVPLKGVVCKFCKDAPHFYWQTVLNQEEVRGKLKLPQKEGKIKDIVILARDKSNRIIDLDIIFDKNKKKFSSKEFRQMLGPNSIRSTNFKISFIGQDILFEGKGWGHGVGLCQWGAYFMAKQGYSYEDILKFYYPSCDVKTIGF